MKIGAVDQGTSSTRLMLVDAEGHSEIRCSVAHKQSFPAPHHSEQDPLELLQNIRTCIAAAEDVTALGLANQGESCLAWDAVTREPLSPVLTWQDNRTSETIERMRQDGAEALTLDQAGLPLSPYFSAGKMQWLVANVPAVQAARGQGRLRLGTTDAFFLHHLTGSCATDLSTASRTSLLNLETKQWDPRLCELFGVPIESLPPIRPTVGDFGAIDCIPVTASIVDQQASLFGHGCRDRGDAKITLGTGAFLLAISGNKSIPHPPGGLFPTVAWQIGDAVTYALDGGVFHAGSALAWLKNLGLDGHLLDLENSTPEPAIARDLIFVPALSGLGCPHWDSAAAAAWIGMTAATTARDLCQAVLEGVALRIVEVMAAISQSVPLRSTIPIDGGMSRNAYFAQFLADASGRNLIASAEEELTAYGCAQLAAVGAGAAIPPAPVSSRCYEPRGNQQTLWLRRFRSAVDRSRNWRSN